MLIFLAILFLFLALCVFFSLRLRNPYQLIFILGKKGSGKSTLLVKLMKRYLKRGYHVYTNMRECVLDGIIYINTEDLGYYRPVENSFVALDEVGLLYDGRKFKAFRDEWRDFYKFQRKYQCVVCMASQTWDVDKKVRDLTDQFYLCRKIGPFSLARRINRRFKVLEAEGDSESRIADSLKLGSIFESMLTFIPAYTKAFDSFQAPSLPYFQSQEVTPSFEPTDGAVP